METNKPVRQWVVVVGGVGFVKDAGSGVKIIRYVVYGYTNYKWINLAYGLNFHVQNKTVN